MSKNIFKIISLAFIISLFASFSCFAASIFSSADVIVLTEISSGKQWLALNPSKYPADNIRLFSYDIQANTNKISDSGAVVDAQSVTYTTVTGSQEVSIAGATKFLVIDKGYIDSVHNTKAEASARAGELLGATTKTSRTSSGGNGVAKRFSSLSDQLGSNIDKNFDYFGIGISSLDFSNTPGNMEFINNEAQIKEFKELLQKTKYDTKKFDELIEYLKSLANFEKYKMEEKKYMEFQKVAVKAKTQKDYKGKTQIGADVIETIFKTIGLICVFYAFFIAIAGAIDETGMVDKGLTNLLTAGKLNKGQNPGWNKDGRIDEGKAFRFSYLFMALILAGIGMVCISPTARGFIADKISWIITKFKDIFHIV